MYSKTAGESEIEHMRKLILFLLLASPCFAQSTKLQLGLYWSSGAQIANATTTITNSKGTVIAKATGSWPTVSANLPADLYTVTVTAPATSDKPAVNWSVTLPLASSVAGFAITSQSVRITLDATGQHGTLQASVGATF